MDFPKTIPLKIIDAKHAEHQLFALQWDRMSLMYHGGSEMYTRASEFLRKRPKELGDIYQARLERFTYHNHIGVVLDWYAAAIFEEKPPVQPADGGKLSTEQTEFYDEFDSNCDRGGMSIIDKFRQLLVDMLTYGRCAVLVDLPKQKEYATLADQKADHALDPYLCRYDPRQVINWSTDATGVLEWVIISLRVTEAPPLAPAKQFDRWYYFDKQNYAVYQREVKPEEKSIPEDATAEYVDSGAHALADKNMVPLFVKVLPKGLWLANRSYLPALDLINTDNVLSWALQLAALAMPVIKTAGEYQPTLSEAGFIKLDQGDEFDWAEPEGKSFGHLADRCLALTEDIYRACYLTAQARSNAATPAAQSGYSKRQDMMPARKILGLLGSMVRNTMQQVYNAVSVERGDDIEWDVRGLEFPEDPPNSDVQLAQQYLDLNVPSDTADKEVFKNVVGVMLRGANPATLQKVIEEIDASPSRQEIAQQNLEQRASILGSAKALKVPNKLPGDDESPVE